MITNALLIAWPLILATDVAAEMGALETEFSSCKICYNACSAAVKMLAVSDFLHRIRQMLIAMFAKYKCQRLPTSIKGLKDSETGDQWLSVVMEKYAR